MNETGSSQHISAEAVPLEQRAAEAMAAKRRELIAQPLERIWPDLARAAIAAMPGEPVAYRWRWADAPTDAWSASTVNPDQLGKIVEPLYAAPAMPATDAVREALESSKAAMLRTRAASIAGSNAHGDLTRAIKLCDAALSHPSQGGWQDITPESPPAIHRKGYLVTRPGSPPIRAHRTPDGTWRMHGNDLAALTGEYEPTHWQPLPAPPEVQP